MPPLGQVVSEVAATGNLAPELPIDSGSDLSADFLKTLGVNPSEFTKATGIKPGLIEGKAIKSKGDRFQKVESKVIDDPRKIIQSLGNKKAVKENDPSEGAEDAGDDHEELPNEETDLEDSASQDEEAEGDEAEEGEEETAAESEVEEFEFKGKTIKIDAELKKELFEKGLDYTRKTQQLAKQVRGFKDYEKEVNAGLEKATAHLEKQYSQLGQKVDQLEQWNHTVDAIKEENPELYEDLMEHFRHTNKTMRNPRLEKTIQSLQLEIQSLKKGKEQESISSIREGFKKEMGQFQKDISPKLSQLGMKADWDKVKDAWVDSDGSVEDAFYSVYGKKLTLLYNSKLKTGKTIAQANRQKTGLSIRKGSAPVGLKGKIADLSKVSFSELATRLVGS